MTTITIIYTYGTRVRVHNLARFRVRKLRFVSNCVITRRWSASAYANGRKKDQICRMTASALLLVRRRHASLCIENPYAACIICKTPSITVRDGRNTPDLAEPAVAAAAAARLARNVTAPCVITYRLTLLPFRYRRARIAARISRGVTVHERFIGIKDDSSGAKTELERRASIPVPEFRVSPGGP